MNTVVVQKNKFYNAEDVAALLDISVSSAYRIIKKLNEDLSSQGKITVAGKISIRFFNEKTYI